MTDEQWIRIWAMRLRHDIPNVAAVILKGSYARETAGAHSDLDFDVIVDREPHQAYLAWFDETDTGDLRHVSVAVQDLVGWMSDARESESWAYGLAAAETTRLIWARDDMLRTQLDRPAKMHPAEEPELEDCIEAWGKARNALDRNDDLAMRLATQKLGRLCPTLLRVLNPEVFPSNRKEAMQAVLAFPIAPEGYRDDLKRCLGLSGEATSIADLYEAARRLIFGTVALVRAHADTFDGLLPDDLLGYLRDGTLERYIRQIAGARKVT